MMYQDERTRDEREDLAESVLIYSVRLIKIIVICYQFTTRPHCSSGPIPNVRALLSFVEDID